MSSLPEDFEVGIGEEDFHGIIIRIVNHEHIGVLDERGPEFGGGQFVVFVRVGRGVKS